MMGAVDKFLHKLENFDKENIPTKVIKALQPYLKVKFSVCAELTHTLALYLDEENLLIDNLCTVHFQDPEFDPQKILAKSVAAGGLCAWVKNVHNFYNVFLVVEPKQRALEDAQNELKAAQDKLDFLNNKILVSKRCRTDKRTNEFRIVEEIKQITGNFSLGNRVSFEFNSKGIQDSHR